jgi:hypothetical protein
MAIRTSCDFDEVAHALVGDFGIASNQTTIEIELKGWAGIDISLTP